MVDELKYKKMWEELKRQIEERCRYNNADTLRTEAEGKYYVNHWYKGMRDEDERILEIMARLEKEVD